MDAARALTREIARVRGLDCDNDNDTTLPERGVPQPGDRPEERTYRVIWEIDVDSTSPVEAAKIAREIQQDKKNDATVFKVVDTTDETTTEIDLSNSVCINVHCRPPEDGFLLTLEFDNEELDDPSAIRLGVLDNLIDQIKHSLFQDGWEFRVTKGTVEASWQREPVEEELERFRAALVQ